MPIVSFVSIAAALACLIGIGCALGGIVLRNGKPESWADVTANDTIVKRTSYGLIIISLLLFATSAMAVREIPWGNTALAASSLLFAAAGFWGNQALFGDPRPKHTLPNCLLVAAILALLWLA